MKPGCKIDDAEYMVFYLSEGDLSRRESILNTEISQVYKYFYLKKLQHLNQMIDHLEVLKQSERR